MSTVIATGATLVIDQFDTVTGDVHYDDQNSELWITDMSDPSDPFDWEISRSLARDYNMLPNPGHVFIADRVYDPDDFDDVQVPPALTEQLVQLGLVVVTHEVPSRHPQPMERNYHARVIVPAAGPSGPNNTPPNSTAPTGATP